MDILQTSFNPHKKANISTRKVMLIVLIALLPIVIFSIYAFYLNALFIILASVLACVVTEFAWNLATKKRTVDDLSACVTGVIFALTLPPTVPLFIPIIGGVFAILFCKMVFGGLGKNIVNPAVTARVFVMLAFPSQMMGNVWVDNSFISMPTVLPGINDGNFAGNFEGASLLDLLLGRQGGSLGETCALLILVIGIILIAIKMIDWIIPTVILATVAFFALVCGGPATILPHLLSGGLLFGAVFMATDYVTSPRSTWGKIIFAFIIGAFTMLVRLYGAYPEGVSLAILLANLLVPVLNKIDFKTTFGLSTNRRIERLARKEARKQEKHNKAISSINGAIDNQIKTADTNMQQINEIELKQNSTVPVKGGA